VYSLSCCPNSERHSAEGAFARLTLADVTSVSIRRSVAVAAILSALGGSGETSSDSEVTKTFGTALSVRFVSSPANTTSSRAPSLQSDKSDTSSASLSPMRALNSSLGFGTNIGTGMGLSRAKSAVPPAFRCRRWNSQFSSHESTGLVRSVGCDESDSSSSSLLCSIFFPSTISTPSSGNGTRRCLRKLRPDK